MRDKRSRVRIRPPRAGDEEMFLRAVRKSRRLHRPWVSPPPTPKAFRALLARSGGPANFTFLVCLRGGGELAGVVQMSEIVRGLFRSAYLSYYAFSPYAGQGYMGEGLSLVIAKAFGALKLHRLEANVQPGNRTSIALVRRLGFRKEGLSPRYLKIGGRWKDHERWAILSEEWRARSRSASLRERRATSYDRQRD